MYRQKVKRELAGWVERDLLPAEIAERLLRDLDSRRDGFSIGQVLLMLAAAFMAAALLLFVSSNWDVIPRIVRLGGVILLIWIFHLGGARFYQRGMPVLGAALLLLGTAAFGGGLSLAGQMYHIAGDMTQMLAVWLGAAVLTAVLFRSSAVAVAAGLIAYGLCWSLLDASNGDFTAINLVVPPLLSTLILVLSRWVQDAKIAQFSFLMLLCWAFWLYTLDENVILGVVYAGLGFALLAAVSLSASPVATLAGRMGGVPAFYALLLAGLGVLILLIEYHKGMALMMAAIAGLLIAVGALALAGRDHGGVRWLAYGMIAAIVFDVWVTTIGSILGTSGFFLMASLVAAVLAFLVSRLEKRFAAKRALAP